MREVTREDPVYGGESMGGRVTILLIAVGMVSLLVLPLQAAPSRKPITDAAITLAVEGDLSIDEGVIPNLVGVNTSQGVVTLSGSVSDLLAKRRAVKIAESIRGVRAVVDRITVTPVSRPDEDIQKDVQAALLQDPATESYKLDVSVKDAVITLTGTVGSWPEKQLAAWVAEGVKGAKEVRNDIQIDYLTKRTDQEIAADINDRLQWDIWVNGLLVQADVKNGQVALTGAVGSAVERRRADEDAWVNGVTSVDDSGLKVDPWARDEGRRKFQYAIRSDDEIRRAVEASFRRDPRVSPFPPDVTVDAGFVTLSGTVGNLKAKVAAAQDARDTVGVISVDNFVNVQPQINSDLEKNLKAALLRDPILGGTPIQVAVINHVAYLSGTVENDLQKVEAQDIAERTKGVVLVRNHLMTEADFAITSHHWPYYYEYEPYYHQYFQPRPVRSDQQIRHDIEREFFWSPFVFRDEIKLTVHHGVATLTGTVGSTLAYNEAQRDAYKGGASFVNNNLWIKRGAWF